MKCKIDRISEKEFKPKDIIEWRDSDNNLCVGIITGVFHTKLMVVYLTDNICTSTKVHTNQAKKFKGEITISND